MGKVVSMALSVVAKLRIADKLANGPKSIAELANETRTHERSLFRVMRAMASVGVFQTDEEGRFELTPVGELLRTDVKGSMRGMADFFGADWSWKAWGGLPQSIQTGNTAFNEVFGEGVFEYLEKHPEESAVFNEAMTGFSSASSEAVVAAYDFSRFNTLVDVGGGHGALLITILQATPSLKGIVFDAPHVAEGAHEPIRAAGLEERCKAIGGDFFESIPSGGDAYILKHIIHDWNDEDAARILGNIRNVMQPGNTLLLVEGVIPPGDAPHFAKLLDLEMFVVASGRERTAHEFEALLANSGFRLNRFVKTKSSVEVIEAEAV